jgi:2-succinyl-5-enolpyruvyl-6-hydroxy-3-cyclohexene-1-carboxylate synthase
LEPRGAAGDEQSALTLRVGALLAAPLTRHVLPVSAPAAELTREIAQALVAARAGAIVVGPLPPQRRAMADALAQLAGAVGFPILAEASSQMRFALKSSLACPEFGWLLCSEPLRRRHAPDLLLYLGATPTCAELERWALESAAPRYVLAEHGSPDSQGNARVVGQGDLALSLEALRREISALEHRPHAAQRAFADGLLDAGRACAALVREELAAEPALAEGAAVACIAGALPDGAQWMLGNSLPLRDVDAYVSDCADVVILSQRGANGIDGLVSGAAGSALGAALPTLLLLGDVSLLHDLSGLDAARSLRTPLVLAVIDNDGGRIFDQLPVHELYEAEPDFAPFWRTSPGVDLRHSAALFGLHYSAPTTETELALAAREALHRNSATLLHVRVGRDSARRVRERVQVRLAASHPEASA